MHITILEPGEGGKRGGPSSDSFDRFDFVTHRIRMSVRAGRLRKTLDNSELNQADVFLSSRSWEDANSLNNNDRDQVYEPARLKHPTQTIVSS